MSKCQITIPGIIEKKRDGKELTAEEIHTFISALVKNNVQDAQIGAWLMAAYLNGLSVKEVEYLTHEMRVSGQVLEWPPEWKGQLADKHSTGGVGDKVSLILAPALAACDLKVPMISGRGLAHTGGTLDKLEAIPNFSVSMNTDRMREILQNVGCCIVGQTADLVPADKILYATRDVTATVPNFGLITSSIVSKKAAENIDSLVLDIKVGNGAFMTNMKDAEQLAKLMVSVGNNLNIHTAALITSMDCPLGHAVGNALEVAESIHCLQGGGPKDLKDLIVQTGGLSLKLAGKVETLEKGQEIILKVLANGSALSKFKEMVIAQGASSNDATRLCDPQGDVWNVLTPAKYKSVLECTESGTVEHIWAMPCAEAAHRLGGGRTKAGQSIDLAVGLEIMVDIGQTVSKGDAWVTIHHSTPEVPQSIVELLQKALVLGSQTVHSMTNSSRVMKTITMNDAS